MHTGDLLAQFEIRGLIGSGGMGEVYRARDTVLDRDVALKILPLEWNRDPERLARFRREAKVLASLNHPGIAGIYGLEEAQDRTFLVMELVEGRDLAEIMAEGPLPLERALDIAVRIATGLEEAHRKGFIHRDLKPANIKITPDDKVKILDFGLARALVEEPAASDKLSNSPTITAAMTQAGVILGTAAYMSPEQARGKDVDERADIWAFGCILLEMLTGRAFFAGDTFSDTLASILKTDPVWDDLPAELPRGVLRLLRRCLAKDPGDRLHSIADARIELQDMSREPRTVTGHGSAGGRNGARSWAGWIAAAVLAGVAGVLAVLLLGNGPDSAALPPRLDALTYQGREWSPDVSPDGNLVVFTSDRDGTPRIWMKEVAGGGEVALTSGPDDLPRFSSDGSQILFTRDVQGNRQLYRKTIVGNQLRKVLDDAIEGDWSPDGQSVAFLRARPEIGENTVLVGIATLQSGAERILGSIEKRACYGLRWSPDRSFIAVNTTSLTGNVAETSGIHLFDAETGEVTFTAPTRWTGPYSALEWSPDGKGFIIGQSDHVIAHVTGSPSLIMEYDLAAGTMRPLFWAKLRLPKGSWGSTTLAVLADGDIVLDHQEEFAQLLRYPLGSGAPGSPEVLSTGLSIDRQPVFSPDGARLMYSSNRSGNVDIWIRDLESRQDYRLTDDEAGDWDPAFTPDGQSVLWSSDRSGNMEIWMASIDGSGARQVTRDGVDAENPTMTPDGQWIVYASGSDAKRGIWKIRPDGTEATRLAAGDYLIPEVSPDGRFALFMFIHRLDAHVKVVEIETGRILDFSVELNITQRDENLVFGRARWAPDGQGIVFIGQDEAGNSGVFLTDFEPGGVWDGSRRKVAGFDPRFTTESLGMSPDGGSLVIAALNERRTLERASHVDLKFW
ncbi:serine/threonine-protein kinase [bacterium]|nr:serine/threonine-protein kinase [bacterium]